ncbi:MAG: hypothetical protein CVU07_10060, partial [Bacteroidetes bacterium HGW-Bacteroidetes-23]
MSGETSSETKTLFKQWLEKLQQESWQLELLISGFALFGIYSSRVLIADFGLYIENDISSDNLKSLVKPFFIILKVGWVIFFFNLLGHVIMRGLWIGAIGLRYVSQEIEYDKFNYSEIFTQFLKKKVGSYDDWIERLEMLCSVIFAYTFLLFALFMSLVVFFIPVILIRLVLELFFSGFALNNIFGLTIVAYVGLGIFVLFDLITLGGIKRIKEKSISKIYFYIYRFYSTMTLSFLYRPLLYNFIDHPYTKKLFYLSIPYILLVFLGGQMFTNTYNPYSPDRNTLLESGELLDDYFYDDLREKYLVEYPNEERKINKNIIKRVSLEHFNIKENFSSVFIKITPELIELLENDPTLSPYSSKGLSFTFFNENEVEDQKITSLEKQKSKAISDLLKEKRALKKEKTDSEQKSKIENVERQIELEKEKWNTIIKKAEIDKSNTIKKTYLS